MNETDFPRLVRRQDAARRRVLRGHRHRPLVEVLDGRVLLSYLVIERAHRVVPIYTADARSHEPLSSNGLAVKKAPHFYQHYTGPQRADLNGIRATGYLSGSTLVLSGTVAGPISAHPATASESSIYTFAIDRGGSPKQGPFPGRNLIRFDSEVVVSLQPGHLTAFVSVNDPVSNTPTKPPKSLPSSSVAIAGSTVTVRVPLSLLPSTGKAYDQWNVNFFTRNPNQKQNFQSVASFTPEFTEFQVADRQPVGS